MSDLHEVHNFLHVLSYLTNVRLLEELWQQTLSKSEA